MHRPTPHPYRFELACSLVMLGMLLLALVPSGALSGLQALLLTLPGVVLHGGAALVAFVAVLLGTARR